MKTSERGLELIKSFEGCRLTAYRCPAGVWTIGWGHTGGVKQGQVISQMEADALLVSDLAVYEAKVDKYNGTYGWNQNEFDALVSFAYNIGSIDQLTANGTRSRDVIAAKMLEYNKSGGTVLAGLTRRREAERGLFLTPVQAATAIGWNRTQYGWWYQFPDGSYPAGCWQTIGGHRYYFNPDGYALTDWHEIDGKWYYFEPRPGDPLECALYVTDADGAQGPGVF